MVDDDGKERASVDYPGNSRRYLRADSPCHSAKGYRRIASRTGLFRNTVRKYPSTPVKDEAVKGRAVKGKPVRHSPHRTPTQTQQARWEAVQLAREQGLSLRAIARNLGMAKNTAKKYAVAESPPTKNLSAKERTKADAQAESLMASD